MNNNDNIQQKETQQNLLTWTHMKNMQSDKSDIALCLSELIDNSISSFEENNERIRNGEELKIDIECFETDDNKLEYHITDNANGIKDLLNSMLQYETSKLEINSKKNQYGIGMKFAIFWLGTNGVIYTKRKGDEELIGTYVVGPKNTVLSNKDISHDNQIKTESGTKIIIKDIDKSMLRSIVYSIEGKNSNITYLKDFLGKRFYGYLDNNNPNNIDMSITIKYYDKNKVLKPIDKNDAGDDIYKVKIKPVDVFNVLCKDKRNNRNSLIPDDKLHQFKEKLFTQSIYNDFKNIWDTLLDDKPLVFNDEMRIYTKCNLPNGSNYVDVPIKIGFQYPDKRTCGLNIKHSDRYICHSTLRKNQNDKIVDSYKIQERYKDGNHKWIIGEIELEKIQFNENCQYIKPDKNKSNIIFDNICFTSDSLIDAYTRIFEKYHQFIKKLIELNSIKSKVINDEESLEIGRKNKELISLTSDYDDKKNEYIIKNDIQNSFLFLSKNSQNKKEIRFCMVSLENKDSLWDIENTDEAIIYKCNKNYSKINFNGDYDENDNEINRFKINTFCLLIYFDNLINNNTTTSVENILGEVTKRIEEYIK